MAEIPADPSTRPSLLLRLRDPADADSWQTFVTVYAPLVYGYCRRHGAQHADAEDVAQQVLARVSQAIRDFCYDRERGRFRDWLGTVTRHELARHLGRQERAGRGAGGDDRLAEVPAPEADGDWDAAFRARVLEAALERVRPHFGEPVWRAFEGVWRQGRPAPEVAAELGLPIDAVYSAKSRVLKRLREEILLLAEDVPHLL
jgi:RNA polymerase sigma-70 factor (ECF subfamily)